MNHKEKVIWYQIQYYTMYSYVAKHIHMTNRDFIQTNIVVKYLLLIKFEYKKLNWNILQHNQLQNTSVVNLKLLSKEMTKMDLDLRIGL